jgi:AraC family ethanolamine operon transcriptional activator
MDADDHAANLTAWKQLYDQLTPGRFSGSITELWLDGLQVFCETTSHTVRQTCEVWPGSWWFGIPLHQGASVRIGGAAFAGDSIAVRPGGAEFELLTPNRFQILGIVVQQKELTEYIHATEGIEPPSVLSSQELLHTQPEMRSRAQWLLRQILDEVAATPELMLHAASRNAIRNSVMQMLTELCRPFMLMQPEDTALSSRHALVSKIREQLLDHHDAAISIPDICRNFFVSRRTLQNAFQQVVGMSPGAYLRVLRLNGVRRALRDSASPFTSVQEAACEWGFWHLSQFSCDYKRMFGELPSESLRLRNARR